jgi:hypothetical protein
VGDSTAIRTETVEEELNQILLYKVTTAQTVSILAINSLNSWNMLYRYKQHKDNDSNNGGSEILMSVLWVSTQ